jgi:putative DNA primase/helicase
MAQSKIERALEHSRAGRAVFPLHWIRLNGSCSCGGRPDCTPGKHPQWHKDDLQHGVLNATIDEEQIRAWWQRWSFANIGVACGKRSGFWVLDVDPRHGGDDTLAALERENGELPRTPEQLTAGGGRHLCFALPGDFEVRNIQRNAADESPLGKGLDLRGEGGYVVGAGSAGPDETVWEWEAEHHPDDLPFQPAPEWLLRKVRSALGLERGKTGWKPGPAEPLSEKFPYRTQHNTLVSMAGRMRRAGMTPAEIDASLQIANRERCERPGTPKAMTKIAESMAKYPPGEVPYPNGATEQEEDAKKASRDEIFQAAEEAKRNADEAGVTEHLQALAVNLMSASPLLIDTWTKRVVVAKLTTAKVFDAAVRDAKRTKREQKKDAGKDAATGEKLSGDELNDAPDPNVVIPSPYFVNAHCTARQYVDDNGQPQSQVIALSPILITARMRDANEGNEFLRLSWRRATGWHDRTVDRASAMNTQKLIELAAYGFPAASDNTKDLTRYLRHLENANFDRLPTARVSSQLGWQGKDGADGFLWGRTLLHPDGEEQGALDLDEIPPEDWREDWVSFVGSDPGDNQIASGFHAAGTLKGWMAAVSGLGAFPKVVFTLYASFAAPLLNIVAAPNFILDLAGNTTTGKTTTARVAGSVWGKPDERSPDSVIGSWDATRVWLERASAVLSSMPLILDDTKRVKNPKMIAELLYCVANGRGRGRGSIRGMAKTPTWRTILISTGENPATEHTEDGGTRTRCLEMHGSPFEDNGPATRRIVDALNQQIAANYGHAGPLFVAHLQKHREEWPEWRERYRAYCEEAADAAETPEGGRLAQYGAIILLAAELATEALSLPWDPAEVFQAVWESMVKEATDAAGETRALQTVYEWAVSMQAAFYGRHLTDSEAGVRIPPGGWIGKWDAADDWDEIAFIRARLDEHLTAAGFSPQMIIRSWKAKGWLRFEEGRNTLEARIHGPGVRCYVVSRKAIEQAR